jgi:hypothetical protein
LEYYSIGNSGPHAKNLKQYDNPFWDFNDGGRKKEKREKVNDYSGTIV